MLKEEFVLKTNEMLELNKENVLDRFFLDVLSKTDSVKNADFFWFIWQEWLKKRNLKDWDSVCEEEKAFLKQILVLLRTKISTFFLNAKRQEKDNLPSWVSVPIFFRFLESAFWQENSLLFAEEKFLKNKKNNDKFLQFDIWAVLQELFFVNVCQTEITDRFLKRILSEDAPLYVKVAVLAWLVRINLFETNEKITSTVLKNIIVVLKNLKFCFNIPEIIFLNLIKDIGKTLWCSAYIIKDNLPVLKEYGLFLSAFSKYLIAKKGIQVNYAKKETLKNLNKKIKIGYLSSHFYDHAIYLYMAKRILLYNKEEFELSLFVLGDKKDHRTEELAKNVDFVKFYTNNSIKDFYLIVQDILKRELDILIYTDIGLNDSNYLLAALPLVKKQCVLVGHGTSTGLSTINYYISGDHESKDAQKYYTEKLIKLPKLGAMQIHTQISNRNLNRSKLDIDEQMVILISTANAMKHGLKRHELYVQILKQVPLAVIIFKFFSLPFKLLGHLKGFYTEHGVIERVRFIEQPFKEKGDVMQLLMFSDIELDTYPYGGWTTNLEALQAGLPIVTQEDGFAKSRWGSGFLKAMGIKYGIAKNEKEYVEQAVLLAKNKELRLEIKNTIKKQADKLFFGGKEAQKAYERVLKKIYLEKI